MIPLMDHTEIPIKMYCEISLLNTRDYDVENDNEKHHKGDQLLCNDKINFQILVIFVTEKF